MDWTSPTLSPETFTQLKNTSLGKLVRDHLLSQIMTGKLQPGQALREPDLVEQLQVSRVPVREALRELESLGLVVSRKHSGVTIRELTAQEVHDLYQFRALMDSHAGRVATQLPAVQQRELICKLQSCIATMDEAIETDDTQAYYNANLQFHWLFIQYANNQEIAKCYREVIQKLHLARVKNLSSTEHRIRSNAEHKQIVCALQNSHASIDGPSRCTELLAHHVTNAHERLTGI